MWQHVNYKEIVEAAWKSSTDNNPIFALHEKMKAVQKAMKNLNQQYFMDISDKVRHLDKEVQDISKCLHEDPFNTATTSVQESKACS